MKVTPRTHQIENLLCWDGWIDIDGERERIMKVFGKLFEVQVLFKSNRIKILLCETVHVHEGTEESCPVVSNLVITLDETSPDQTFHTMTQCLKALT